MACEINEGLLHLLSFYATRHQPFIKQVHSPAHTIILIQTKEFRRYFIKHNCKQKNTTNGIVNLHTHPASLLHKRSSQKERTTHEVS